MKEYINRFILFQCLSFIKHSLADITTLGDDDLVFKVKYDGTVRWDPPGLYQTHCDIDTTWYPFDEQKCYIELASWGYTKDFITLSTPRTTVNLEDYKTNGEWVIAKTEIQATELVENGERFAQLEFILLIDRRSGYYIMNIIFPIVLTAVLTTVQFLLPADSGEKISYILTVLLALAVLLTLIADGMPTTSLQTSILGILVRDRPFNFKGVGLIFFVKQK